MGSQTSNSRRATPAPAVTAEQVDAVMLAAQALIGVTAQSVATVEHAVTLPQLRALMLVASRRNLNLNTLAQAMQIHPSNATRVCDRLVSAGLLERRSSSTDRRSLLLELTDDGARLIDSVTAMRRAAIAEVLAQVPPSRRRALAAAMRAFGRGAGEEPLDDAWKLGWTTRGSAEQASKKR